MSANFRNASAAVRPGEDDDRPMRRIYLAVVAVELVVLAGLWAFSRYFGP